MVLGARAACICFVAELLLAVSPTGRHYGRAGISEAYSVQGKQRSQAI